MLLNVMISFQNACCVTEYTNSAIHRRQRAAGVDSFRIFKVTVNYQN